MPVVNAAQCYGPVRRFNFVIGTMIVPNPLLPGDDAFKVYFAVNGSMPGPAIDVNEGDWVEVTVTNNLVDATTLHWHGMLNVLTPFSDGVPSTSQCPIQPGGSMVYGFRASNAGTYW